MTDSLARHGRLHDDLLTQLSLSGSAVGSPRPAGVSFVALDSWTWPCCDHCSGVILQPVVVDLCPDLAVLGLTQGIVKQFFNEKEVTSTLVMDALFCGCRQLDKGNLGKVCTCRSSGNRSSNRADQQGRSAAFQ